MSCIGSMLVLRGITFLRTGKQPNIRNSSPPLVVTTLARLSLNPQFRIAFHSLRAFYRVVERDRPALTLLPSPIFPSSSPHPQYSGLSFLAALTKKLPTVFSEIQRILPTDPSHHPKYIQLTNTDVDSKIVRELLLFVKESLTTILTITSTIDTLIASLPSDSSQTTPGGSEVDTQMAESLTDLRIDCNNFLCNAWDFVKNVAYQITDPHKPYFQTIILDDPSFSDLILSSIKLTHQAIRFNVLTTIMSIIVHFRSMRDTFLTANLVKRMFETVDFVSLPFSESNTLFELTKIILGMLTPIGSAKTCFEKFPLIRVSVFEPAKQFITFIFHNSEKLILNEELKSLLDRHLCEFHLSLKHLDLQSDEHNSELVSGIVKWNARWTIKMGKDDPFRPAFESILSRTCEWKRNKAEQQKRQEIGWDLIPDLIEFVMDNMKSSLSSLSPPDSLIHPLPRQTTVKSPRTPLESMSNTQESESLNELRERWIDDISHAPKRHCDDTRSLLTRTGSLQITCYKTLFSVSETHLYLTQFIVLMLESTVDEEFMEHYRIIRASIFEPAKPYITFMFHNWDRLPLDQPLGREDHENAVCLLHCHIKNIEIKFEEHEPALVSVIVKWEVRTMVTLENEDHDSDSESKGGRYIRVNESPFIGQISTAINK
ncbi:hypothetical protein BLNAU_8245 [Blattamonas nauphoetae]|uniref:Uncharacterized protein n=1 Tax=Blattamonas nauphoetae TaxID=2049346 RepID=A0ABQ9XZ56_9EUKA|nr:hypothetical protein BLNAU_8245 [Blattamonas nauphoetae]